MWLALLLAATDDALTGEARRAATHEMARRLAFTGRTTRPLHPPVGFQMMQAYEALATAWLGQVPKERTFLLRGFGFHQKQRDFAADINTLYGLSRFLPFADTMIIRLNERPYSSLISAQVTEMLESVYGDSHDTYTTWLPIQDDTHWNRQGVAWIPDLCRNPDAWVRTGMEDLFALFLRSRNERGRFWPQGTWEGETLRDWFVALRPDLSTMTWPEAVAAADAWHLRMRHRRVGGIDYRGPVPDGLVVLRWSDGVTLQRLLTKREFQAEGVSMGHCVGGDGDLPDGDSHYWRATRDDAGAIWSLRAPNGVPMVTIEGTGRISLRKPSVVVAQVQGVDDGPIGGQDGANDDPVYLDCRPYVLDALVRMRLLATPQWSDAGSFGQTRDQADEALGLEPSVGGGVYFDALGNEVDAQDVHSDWTDPTRFLGAPTWFPDLDAAARARAMQMAEAATFRTPGMPWLDPDEVYVRLSLAPRSEVLKVLGRTK